MVSALNPQLGWGAQWKRVAVPKPDRICRLMLGLCMADSLSVMRLDEFENVQICVEWLTNACFGRIWMC